VNEPEDILVVLVTAPNSEEAAKMAQTVVSEKLVACVNLVAGVRSIYSWKGDVCDDPETLLIMKTRRLCFELLKQRIQTLHPYEVPEIIALPVAAGWEPYLGWVRSETTGCE